MGTRLEQIQAAVKAASANGQTPFNVNATNGTPKPATTTPVQSPSVKTPSVATPNISSVSAPNLQNEIQRKASMGIPLTNQTNAANNSAYTSAVNANKVTTPVMSPSVAPTTPNTNYVAQGGQTLNDILYLKKQYEGGKTGAAQYAGASYNKLDPQTAAMVKGMNAAQLESYISGQGRANNPAPTTPNQMDDYGQMNGQNYPTTTMPTRDYRALAQAQYDQELSALLTGAKNQETELNRRFDYANGITQDNRLLQDASFYRNNAPTAWDGSTGYRGAQNDRNRSTEDHYSKEALTDATAAAYGQANNFRDQAGNYLTTAANKLQDSDRQFSLQEGSLTGNYNGGRTLAGQAQDYNQGADQRNFNYKSGQDNIQNNAQYGGTFNGNKTVQQQQQEWQNRFNYGQAIGQFPNGQQTLNAQNQTFNQGVTMAQLTGYLPNGQATSDQQKLNLQNLWMAAEQTGVIPDTLANLYGLPKGTQTQSALQFAQKLDIDRQQLSISQQNANTSQYSAQNSTFNNQFGQLMDIWKASGVAPAGIPGVQQGTQYSTGAAAKAAAPKTYESLQSNIDKVAKYDKKGVLTNPNVVEEYILNSPLSDYEMYRAYLAEGLKWGGAIPSQGE